MTIVFWIVAGVCVALGLLPGGRVPAITVLFAAGLLLWLRLERRGAPPPAGGTRAEPIPAAAAAALTLDDADRRLAGRLLALRSRRVAQRMLPLARAATLREDASLADALALLRATRVTRIPLMDTTGRRAAGLIDGRDLLAHAFSLPAPAGSVREVASALPEVRADATLLAAVEALRASPAGAVAVVDGAGAVAGFLAWDHVFRALLSRAAGEVSL
jgi:CBS domain containing-hemolysin-like protein